MTNKKILGFSILGIIIVFSLYYLNSGSSHLTAQLKSELNTQLSSIQNQGFTIKNRNKTEKTEHFIVSFDEPKKIAAFLNTQGAHINSKEIEILKGFKIGVDVSYIADAYSAISFDMYPLTLPTAITSSTMNDKDKKSLKQIQAMLKKKTFLLHMDINKLGTGFKGYIKDINEKLEGNHTLKFMMSAFHFTGDIQNNKLSGINQTLQNFTLKDDKNTIDVQLNNLKSNYTLTGSSKYDYETNYSIDEMHVISKNTFQLSIHSIVANSNSKVTNNLASIKAHTSINNIDFTNYDKTSKLNTLVFDMNANNFDINILKKLETIDSKNKQEVLNVLQELISHNISFEIPNFSIKDIEFENQKLDGLRLASSFHIDKSLNLASLEQNPLVALGSINADIDLSLSNKLFEFIAKQPRAMMLIMLIHPQTLNGEKVYKVKLKNGKLTVNNKPVM